MASRVAMTVLALCLGCVLGGFSMYAVALSAPTEAPVVESKQLPEVNDVAFAVEDVEPEIYEFTEHADMQNPELPTGCEATALAAMFHRNDINVSKQQIADAMPKSDGENFVTAFWGDPYSDYGWACMAPCVAETAKRFLPVEKTVVDLTGTDLVYLPTPCVVWVTMYFEDPIPSEYEQDGYELFWNPHCVVMLEADEATVTVWDPLEGEQVRPFSRFNELYMRLGKQAVYIANRGYEPKHG